MRAAFIHSSARNCNAAAFNALFVQRPHIGIGMEAAVGGERGVPEEVALAVDHLEIRVRRKA